jgi:hypothetical protein
MRHIQTDNSLKEQEIISILEEISMDLRAEILIADLIKKGFALNDLLVRPVGLFKRRFGKDIAKIETVELKNDQRVLRMDINREGLYDTLPQALFHNPSRKPKPFKSVKEMVDEVKVRLKEEEDARKFFFAYEIEFFKQRLANEWQERKLLETITYSMDDEKILSYWNLPELFDERQKGILFYLLPVIHKIRSHLNLMEETYVAILKDKVKISKSQAKMTNQDSGLNLNTLGNSILSTNFILGKRNYNIYENILIEVGPVHIERIFDYLPGGRNRKIIGHLDSLFMPVHVESEVNVLVQKEEWHLQSKNKNSSRLGYSAFV